MFEDLQYEPTEAEQIEILEQWKDGALKLLREGRDEIERLEKENKFFEHRYVEAFTDAKRLIKHLQDNVSKDVFDEIMKEDKE